MQQSSLGFIWSALQTGPFEGPCPFENYSSEGRVFTVPSNLRRIVQRYAELHSQAVELNRRKVPKGKAERAKDSREAFLANTRAHTLFTLLEEHLRIHTEGIDDSHNIEFCRDWEFSAHKSGQ